MCVVCVCEHVCTQMGVRCQHHVFFSFVLYYSFLRQGLSLTQNSQIWLVSELQRVPSLLSRQSDKRYVPLCLDFHTDPRDWAHVLMFLMSSRSLAGTLAKGHLLSPNLCLYSQQEQNEKKRESNKRAFTICIATWSRYNIRCSGNEAKIKSILLFINILLQKHRILPANV